jgi:glutamate/tyrosine decarboxylase-like PLP-dependent enzyme
MLLFEKSTREELWRQLIDIAETYVENVGSHRVSPRLDPQVLRSMLRDFDFQLPRDPGEVLQFAAKSLWEHQTHTPHPSYFGLFNPAPATMSILGDALAAVFNPQLAAWSHSPFAAEVERHLVRCFGERFGYPAHSIDGTFTSGGAEANHTALLAALVDRFQEFSRQGTRALNGQPVFYVSTESHHSFFKAARLCGLGTEAMRTVPVGPDLKMNVNAVSDQLSRDRKAGLLPFMVVATAGTTGAGVVDPILEIAHLAVREGLWCHLDAAWGGAAVLVPELRCLLDGCHLVDSITFDAHKWLSVTMGAGVFLTRHTDVMTRAFHVGTTYMPREAEGLEVVDPYVHSMQWSRRFIGLKVFLSLAVAGWEGYAEAIRSHTRVGRRLRQELVKAGWEILNQTPLPVVCFTDPARRDSFHLDRIVERVLASGEAWISRATLGGTTPAIRACITNFRTGEKEAAALVQSLELARKAVGG